MPDLFENTLNSSLIPTKVASEISGYNADYLARLCREEKILGTQVGRSWFINRASLEEFVKVQEEKKRDRAEALRSVRGKEYRRAQKPVLRAAFGAAMQAKMAVVKRLPVRTAAYEQSTYSRPLAAAAVALMVVAGSAYASTNPSLIGILTAAPTGLVEIALNTQPGLLSDSSFRITDSSNTAANANVASVGNAAPFAVVLPNPSVRNASDALALFSARATAHSFASVHDLTDAARLPLSETETGHVAQDRIAALSSVAHDPFGSVIYAYVMSGLNAYDAGVAFGDTYLNTVSATGNVALTSAATTRDVFAILPRISTGILDAYVAGVVAANDSAPKIAGTVLLAAYDAGNTTNSVVAFAPAATLRTQNKIASSLQSTAVVALTPFVRSGARVAALPMKAEDTMLGIAGYAASVIDGPQKRYVYTGSFAEAATSSDLTSAQTANVVSFVSFLPDVWKHNFFTFFHHAGALAQAVIASGFHSFATMVPGGTIITPTLTVIPVSSTTTFMLPSSGESLTRTNSTTTTTVVAEGGTQGTFIKQITNNYYPQTIFGGSFEDMVLAIVRPYVTQSIEATFKNNGSNTTIVNNVTSSGISSDGATLTNVNIQSGNALFTSVTTGTLNAGSTTLGTTTINGDLTVTGTLHANVIIATSSFSGSGSNFNADFLDGLDSSYFLANSFSSSSAAYYLSQNSTGGSFATSSANYWLTTKSTSDLIEGSNKYYTDARARNAFTSSAAGLTYNNATGDFSLTTGYTIPLTASTSEWSSAYSNRITSATAPLSIVGNAISISQANGTTNGYLSGTDWNTFNGKISSTSLSSTATGLAYNSNTGVFSLTSGYVIPTSASTSAWETFYQTPSSRITAGTNLSWVGNTLNGPADSYIRGLFSAVSPLSYNSGTGVFSFSTSSISGSGSNFNADLLDGLDSSYLLANSFSTSSADLWKSQRNFYSTSSADYWLTGKSTDSLAQGSTNKYYADALVNTFLAASSTVAKTYTSNVFTNSNAFTGGLSVGTLNGPLQANNGVVSATSSVGVMYGGTGLSFVPGYGQVLVGTGTGYALAATSTLGLESTLTFASPLSRSGNTVSILQASGLQNGYLSSTDFTSFNNKISSTSLSAGSGISYNSSTGVISNTGVITFNGRAGAVVPGSSDYTTAQVAESGNLYFTNARAQAAISITGLPLTYTGGVLGINQATASQAGYLTSTDWNTFNNKISSTSLSSTVPGITYTSATGVFSLAGGYNIPTTASTSAWDSFYQTPSSRITAGTNLAWVGNTLNGPSDAYMRGLLSASSPLSYNSSTGVFTFSTSSVSGSGSGLNADLLDGLDSTYFLNRANHTGTQLASTISDFSSAARTLLTSTATGLSYNSATGVFSLTAGYTIPLTASTTDWNTAYQNRITTANVPLSISSNAISISRSSTSVDGYLASTDFNTFNNKISSTSLSAVYPLAYNSSTGVFSTAFSTTTANTYSALNIFNGGITVTGNSAFANASSTNEFSGRITANTAAFGQTGTTTISSTGALSTPSATVGSLSGLIYGNAGVLTAATVSSPLTFSAGALGINQATISTNGYLTSTDFNTFNNKISSTSLSSTATGLTYTPATGVFSLTGGYSIPLTASTTDWNTAYVNRIMSASTPLSISSNAISISQANTSTNGYLSSTDFNTFNSKQTALSFAYPLVNTANTVSLAFGTSTSNTWGGTQTFTNAPVLGSLTGFLKATSGVLSTSLIDLSTDVTSTLPQNKGGTGISTYTAGDILYVDSGGLLAKLPVGSGGQVLKVQAGLPSWGVDQTIGGGGSDGVFATSSGRIYPLDTSNTVIIGSNSTTTTNSIFEVNGEAFVSTRISIGSTSPSSLAVLDVSGNAIISGTGTFNQLIDGGLSANTLTYANASKQLSSVTLGSGLTLVGGTLSVSTTSFSGSGSHLDADTLDGQDGTYYLNRANHTGTQLAATISDFSSAARTLLTSTATGLSYNSGTGVFSLTAGYTIPLTASTTDWNTAYQNRITTANAPLSIAGNAISISQANTSTNGYLSSTDWNTFNGKISSTSLSAVYPLAYNSATGVFSTAFSTTTANTFSVLQTFAAGINVGGSTFTSLLGTGLSNVGGALTVSTTSFSGSGSGLNADFLDGQDGTYYLNRANHTGTQLASTISDFSSAARILLTSTATGLTYTSGTGTFSLTAGYTIPLTASTTDWNTAYLNRITTANAPLSIAGNAISISQANTSTNGYLTSADWNTFNGKISSTSLSAVYPLAYNSATGVFTTAFSTTTANTYSALNTFNGGVVANTATIGSLSGLIYGNAGVLTAATVSSPLSFSAGALSISQANGSTNGYLSSTDFNTFNNKISSTSLSSTATGLTYTPATGVFSLTAGYSIPLTASTTDWNTAYTNRITTANAPLSIAGNAISISLANGSTNGYLSSTDWNTFNGKISSTSLSAVYPLAYNSATGVFSTSFSTTTANTYSALNIFNGGITVTGNSAFANASSTNEFSGRLTANTAAFGQTGTTTISSTGALSTPTATVGSLSGLIYGNAGLLTAATVTGPLTFSAGNLAITQATTGANGYLSSVDFNTFNNKISSTSLSSTATGLTYTPATGIFSLTAGYSIPLTASTTDWNTAYTNRITTANAPLSIAGNAISISQANTSTDGYLSSIDWNTFNGKQAALTGTTGQFPYFSGTNTVTATSSIFLAANGNVGVGTTTPWGQLSVNSNGIAGPSFVIGSSTATKFIVTNGGNTGIQTATPLYPFSVASNAGNVTTPIAFFGQSDGSRGLQIGAPIANGSGGSFATAYINATNGGVGARGLEIRNENVAQMFINSSGVGIGTTTGLAARLDVYGLSGNADLFGVSNSSSARLFTVTSVGNVGIGSSTPYAKLSVAGDIALTGGIYDNNSTRGTNGQVLQTTGTGVQWVSTSSLGFAAAGSGVTSVFGRSGAVTAQSGDYTTAQVTESGNLYFTNARAQAAISNTATGLTYTPATGVFSLTAGYNIPLTASTTDWNTAYLNRITTANAPLSIAGNAISISLANTSTNGYLSSTDWNTFNGKISSTSLSAQYPLAYNSATGVFSTAFSTTTTNTFSALNTFNGGVSASTLTIGSLNGVFYGNNGAVKSVATSSIAVSGAFNYSGVLGGLVGGTNGTLSLATNGVALTNLAQIAANTILANPTGATGNVQAISTSSLGIALSDTKGVLPIARGGTNNTSFTTNGVTYFDGTELTTDSNLSYTGSSLSLTSGSIGAPQFLASDSSGAPGYSWATDMQTGMYHAGSNLIGFATAGVGRVFINGGGYVGIGTSTPSSQLAVEGDALINGSVTANTLKLAGSGFTTLLGTGLSNVGGALTVSTTSFSGSGSGFNADLLDGQDGTYYLNRANHTGTQVAATISDFNTTARGLLSSTATGLTYTSATGVFSLTAGYSIPLTASTTDWNTAYLNRITTANAPLSISSNAISISRSSTSVDGYLASTDFNTFNGKISSTSLSAVYPLAYNSATGVFTTAFSTTTANTFSALNTFNGGLTSSALTIGTLNGPLQANNGVVSATSSVGVTYGGTGLTTAPTNGQVLLGNGAGGYSLVATSTLGFAAAGSGVTSFNGRTGAVVPGSSDYTTAQVTESGNLYFTNARAQAAISVSGLPLTYSAGVIGINQANTGQAGYLSSTDWNTFNGKQAALTGTTGQFPYFSGTNTVTATSTIFLASTGNVGIGTITPSVKLEVSGAARITNAIDSGTTFLVSGITKGLRIGTSPTSAVFEGVDNTGVASYQPLTFGGADLRFNISGVEKARLDTNGNFGIGTSSPVYRLDVAGSGSGNVARFSNGPGTAGAYISSDTNGAYFTNSSISSSVGEGFYLQSTLGIRMYTGGTEKARLTSTGNLGIGTSTPSQVLGVQGNGLFSGNLSSANLTATGTVTFSGLGSGMVKSTGGVLSIANVGVDYAPGTTGVSLLYGNGFGGFSNATLSSPLSFSLGGVLSISQANTSTDGYLSSADWNTFNGKQAALTGTTGQFPYFSGTNTVTATSSIFLAANGYVGIGTTNPVDPFSVKANTANTGFTLYNATGGQQVSERWNAGTGGYIGLSNPSLTSTVSIVANGSSYFNGGNVGLGTTTPTSIFHLYSVDPILTIQNSRAAAVGNSSEISFKGLLPSGADSFIGRITGIEQSTVTNTGDIAIKTYFGGALGEVARFTGTGNVGVGTTSPYAKLSVAGDIALTGGIYDSTATRGTNGQVLQTTGTGVQWVSTSTLGFAAAGSGVTSFNGRTGAVVPTSGDYTTAQVTESGNLYFTNARAQAAISNTATGLTYTSGTGVLSLTAGYSIPLTASTTDWNTAYLNRITTANAPLSISSNAISISRSSTSVDGYLASTDFNTFNGKISSTSLSAQYPLAYNSATGVFTTAFSTTTTNTYSALNTFNGGLTSSALTIGTLNGPLQANNGVVSATSSVGVTYGGTGLTTAPTNGQVLLGNGAGGYSLVATSSLGFASAGSGVTSFNGRTGAVVPTTGDYTTAQVTESGNLYFTNARAQAAISVSGLPLTYSAGVIGINQANTSTNGYLTSADWNTFNSKQAALTFTYPLVNTANTVSLAFGTTTANSWSQLQTFGAGINVGGSTFTSLLGSGLSNVGGALTVSTTSNALGLDNTYFKQNGNAFGGLATLGTTDSNALRFITGGTERARFDTAGNFGIGTSSPSTKLDVVGVIHSSSYTAADLGFFTSVGAGNGMTTLSGNTLSFRTNGVDNRLVIDSSGNVGIGLTPVYKLDVAGDINATGKYRVGATQVVYLPDQTTFTGSSFYGDGGGSLSYTSGNDGRYNTGVGIGALRFNTTGSYNSAQGVSALYSNTTGTSNSAQGAYALNFNTTGSYNSAQGQAALYSNTTGTQNSAQGQAALYSNTTGTQNSAQGAYALYSNTTGTNNSAQGQAALYSNTTGTNNSAQGQTALRFNTTGTQNSAQGVNALYANTTGSNNSAQGYAALYTNTTGSNNSAQGYNAGRFIADGTTANATSGTSLYLGAYTKALADGGANETVIGYNAIGAGSNSVTIGNTAVTKTILQGNVGIGTSTPSQVLSVQGNGLFSGNINAAGLTATGTITFSGISSGLVKSTSGVLSAAVAGTDFAAPTSGSSLLYGNGAGGFSNATVNSPLTFTGGALGIQVANTSQSGYLTNTDWNTFNGKQAALTGTTGQFGYFSGTNTFTATSSIFLAASGNVGVGSTSPYARLSIAGAGTTNGVNFQTTDLANSPLFTILDNGNVGIGSSTPSARLALTGGNFVQSVTTNPVISSTISLSGFTNGIGVYVVGRYAYTVDAGSGFKFDVIDVSNPFLPVVVGSTTDVTTLNGAFTVKVSGNYAYVTSTAGNRLTVIDITNPAAPTVAGSLSNAAFGGARGLYISGKYAYVVGNSSNALAIVDISNPTTPVLMSTLTDATNFSGADSVFVTGKYAYVTAGLSNAMSVVDISNPSAPVRVGTLTDATNLANAKEVYVSGRYAYVVSLGANSLSVIDVSTPSTPTLVGTISNITTLNGPKNLFVAGRYAYVTANSNNRFVTIDISNPTAPIIVASLQDATNLNNARGVFVSGKYAYVPANGKFNVIDINGIDVPSANLGVTNTESLAVLGNTDLGGDLYVHNGLNVGSAGILSGGSLSVRGTLGDNPLTIASSTGTNLLTLNQAGYLGIGTSSPYAALSIGGGNLVIGAATAGGTPGDLFLPKLGTPAGSFLAVDANGMVVATTTPAGGSLTGTTGQVAYFSGTNTAVGTSTLSISSAGNVGVGTGSPTNKLEVAGGALGSGQDALYVSGTLNTANTPQVGVGAVITSAGSGSSATQQAFGIQLLAGYTGSALTAGISAVNFAAGTGTGVVTGSNNTAFFGNARGTTTGTNIGVSGNARGGDISIGTAGTATVAKNSAVNIGVFGAALNSGTSPVEIGGYFGLTGTTPTFTSAALIANNGTEAVDIFKAQSNGSDVFNIASGGNVGIGSTTPSQNLSVEGNAWITNNGALSYTTIGTSTLSTGSLGTSPINGTDNLFVAISSAGTVGIRGAIIQAQYQGSTAVTVQALNASASLGASATADLTATAGGGGLRSRYAAINASIGHNVAVESGLSSLVGSVGAYSSTTVANAYNAETPTGAATSVLTNFYAFHAAGGSYSGTLTNRYGLYIDDMVGGTNRYGVYQVGSSDLNYFAGKTGIGSTTPSASLAVGTASTTDAFVVGVAGSTTPSFIVKSANTNGYVGIGVAAPTAQLHTSGTVRFAGFGAGTLQTDASGNLTVSSDERLKDINGSFSRGLADIQKLSPILYHWNAVSGLDGSTQYAGFSAQNAQVAIPEAVNTDPRGYLTLQDRPILAASVNAIKELAGQTSSLATTTSAFTTQLQTLNDAFTQSQTNAALPHALTATTLSADTLTIAQGISSGSMTTQSVTVSGTVSAARYIVPAEATVFTFGSSTMSAVLPQEALLNGSTTVDIYKLASYGVASVQALASRTDLLSVKIDDIESRLAAVEALTGSTSSNPVSIVGTTLTNIFTSLGVVMKDGIAMFNNLVTHQLTLVGGTDGTSSTGSVTIPNGATSIVITNALVHSSSKIFLTFTSSVDGSWYLSEKKEGSFTISLAKAQPANTTFDYFLLQTDPNAQVAAAGQATATTTPPAGSSEATSTPPTVSQDGGPTVSLNGDAAVQVVQGGVWTDPGATAKALDGTDLTASIVVTGSVDVQTPGLYTITYKATDASAKIGQASRVVTVLAPTTAPASSPAVTTTAPAAPASTPSAPAPTTVTPAPTPAPTTAASTGTDTTLAPVSVTPDPTPAS
jgi:hypothetical protein